MIGGKAESLISLKNIGCNVPHFSILEGTFIESAIYDKNKLLKFINNIINDDPGFRDVTHISIRSSPIHSMPGMMDTKLNIPINRSDLTNICEHILEVYNSYYNKRAILYRKIKNIENIPPSVILQKMVYGNLNDNSGSGIMFTHNLVGEHVPLIEYKKNCQGDKLVNNTVNHNDFVEVPEHIGKQLKSAANIIVTYFKYPQDVEFTVEDNTLYILQSRRLWFGNQLDYKICHNLYINGTLSKKQFFQDLDKIFSKGKIFMDLESDNVTPIATGQPVVGGIAAGEVGRDILLMDVLGNDDIDQLNQYKGVITKSGGLTSHIAIICRNLNIPYIICTDNISGNVVINGFNGQIYRPETVNIINLTKENICAALMDL